MRRDKGREGIKEEFKQQLWIIMANNIKKKHNNVLRESKG